MLHQRVERLLRELRGFPSKLPGLVGEAMLGQQFDIVLPIPERG